MIERKLPPIHPGEVLREEFLVPMQISQYRLAQGISVPPRRINEIVHEKRAVSADTALRLGRFFGMSPEFWINLQAQFDLETHRIKAGAKIQSEVLAYSTPYATIMKAESARATPNRGNYTVVRAAASRAEGTRPTARKTMKHR